MVSELGFEGIEIMADIPHLYPPQITDNLLTDIKKELEKHKLVVSNINSFTLCAVGDMHHPSWIEKDSTKRNIRIKHTIDCINLANKLNCPSISIQPGGKLEDMEETFAMELFVEGLNQVMDFARKKNVKILVEPEPDLLLENSEEFQRFIQKVDTSVIGLNFDIGHFFCAGEDPAYLIKVLRKHIGHFHIEDIAASRIHNHLIPGLGAIDLKSVLKAINETGYDGFISVELYPYQDNPASAGAQAIRYLKEIAG